MKFAPPAGWTGLPRPSAPRWMIPRAPRRASGTGLLLHQPMSTSGWAAWRVARAFAQLGGFRLLPSIPPPPDVVLDSVSSHVPYGGSVAVAKANHPGRYLVLVLDRPGYAVAVAKVATDGLGQERLRHESSSIDNLGSTLVSPLLAPHILAREPSMILLQVVPWRPRLRPWLLPEDVAFALGAMFRNMTRGPASAGPAHGDCAPWNLLRIPDGWVLVDWESARTDAPLFFDVFHYMFRAHLHLGKPSLRACRDGLQGKGWVGAALRAYAQGAGVRPSDALGFVSACLNQDLEGLDETPRGRAASVVRQRFVTAMTSG
jgi:hypothetical protein